MILSWYGQQLILDWYNKSYLTDTGNLNNMVTNYPGHIMQDHTDAYIIGKLDSILTIATKQVHKSRESLVYSDHYSKKKGKSCWQLPYFV